MTNHVWFCETKLIYKSGNTQKCVDTISCEVKLSEILDSILSSKLSQQEVVSINIKKI